MIPNAPPWKPDWKSDDTFDNEVNPNAASILVPDAHASKDPSEVSTADLEAGISKRIPIVKGSLRLQAVFGEIGSFTMTAVTLSGGQMVGSLRAGAALGRDLVVRLYLHALVWVAMRGSGAEARVG